MSIRSVVALALALPAFLAQADGYGRQEHVRVLGTPPIEIVAKLDPGADRSALHAVNVKYFDRDGETWARFTVDNGSVLPGSRVTLERKVLKDLRIKQKGGGVEHRPLVEVELCIGDQNLKAQLSLSDRTGYTAPLVLSKPELLQLGAIDATREFTREPSCKLAPTEPPVEAAPAEKVGVNAAPGQAVVSPSQ